MPFNAWKLPWTGAMVPHAVLDILRGCNISCRACYNTCPPDRPKKLEEIEEELERILRFRRLSSISILGGEVTLHPNLIEIIKLVREKGLQAELITNGLAVDRSMMKELADAGLNIIYFHVEQGQKRSDLPERHSFADINRLRLEKAAIAASFKVDVGLTLTKYPGEVDEFHDTIAFFLSTPEINYLLITLFRDTTAINSLQGDIYSGLHGTGTPTREHQDIQEIAAWLERTMQLKPFAFIGSNLDQDDPRWLSYLIGVVYGSNGNYLYRHVSCGFLEKVAMFFYRVVIKRYPMYMEQDAPLFRKQLFLNGLAAGKPLANFELIRRSKEKDAVLRAKRLLIQNPAELTESGRLLHCNWCPDAVLKNGSLVPVCIADKVRSGK